MEKYSETELLRMTKDQLIKHIFYVYDIHECNFMELGEWYQASESIKKLREKRCGD